MDYLTIPSASRLTGQSDRRLRAWCATGKLHCERDGASWLIPESELGRIAGLTALSTSVARAKQAVALAVPVPIEPAALARKVANRLGLRAGSVRVSRLALDRQEYVVAVWPQSTDGVEFDRLGSLVEELGGELVDRPEQVS